MRFATVAPIIRGVLLLTIVFGAFPNVSIGAELVRVSGAPGSVHILHKSPPLLHIGDNEGNIDDIRTFVAVSSNTWKVTGDKGSRFVGGQHAFRFILEAPSSGKITVKIYSLVRKDHQYDCKTTLQVNDGKEFDLRDGKHVGRKRMTMFSATTSFLSGENRLLIKEHDCLHTSIPALNDSLLYSAEILFTNK